MKVFFFLESEFQNDVTHIDNLNQAALLAHENNLDETVEIEFLSSQLNDEAIQDIADKFSDGDVIMGRVEAGTLADKLAAKVQDKNPTLIALGLAADTQNMMTIFQKDNTSLNLEELMRSIRQLVLSRKSTSHVAPQDNAQSEVVLEQKTVAQEQVEVAQEQESAPQHSVKVAQEQEPALQQSVELSVEQELVDVALVQEPGTLEAEQHTLEIASGERSDNVIVSSQYPKSYDKLWAQLPDSTPLQKMCVVLDDYAKNDSVFWLFFTFHANRHHTKQVAEIVNNIRNGIFTTPEQVFDELDNIKKVPGFNLHGSLMRRISFMKDKINAHGDDHVSELQESSIVQPVIQPSM